MKKHTVKQAVQLLQVEDGRVVARHGNGKRLPEPYRSPEEQWRIGQFRAWLEQTSQELGLDTAQSTYRLGLYERVSELRPYDSMKRHEEVQALVAAWAKAHPEDPVAPKLVEYAETNLENARLVVEAFSEKNGKGTALQIKSSEDPTF